jgi:hypothetical protein
MNRILVNLIVRYFYHQNAFTLLSLWFLCLSMERDLLNFFRHVLVVIDRCFFVLYSVVLLLCVVGRMLLLEAILEGSMRTYYCD